MTIDTEKLREIADFQDFAEHADLIIAAAAFIDDLVLERDARVDGARRVLRFIDGGIA